MIITVDDDEDAAPWEREPSEPAKAYAAFRTFRDSPPASRRIDSTVADVSPRQVRNWAQRHRWRERAEAWDDECNRIEDAERLDAIRSMYTNHRQAGATGLVKAMQALQLMDPAAIPPAVAVRLMEVSAKLERATLVVTVAELQGLEEDDDSEDPWERIARELAPLDA
jgi:hypothetical protein